MKKWIGASLCAFLLLSGCGQETQMETATQMEISGIPSPDVVTEPAGDEGTTADLDVQHFGMFLSESMDGLEISDMIFSNYDLTMVNIWATWCGPCVSEMPDLQTLYTMLPENVNLITMVQDGDSQRDLAEQILNTSGATFLTILPSESINVNVMSKVEAFPTNVFVDSLGNVAAVVTGAPADPVSTYLDYIDQVLAILPEIYGGMP